MKKISLIITICIISIATIAKAGTPDYVITEEGVTFHETLRYGLASKLIGIDNSTRVSYQSNEIIAYKKDGRIYEKMPVVKNNKKTGNYAFMELIAYRNGLKVYKHSVYTGTNMQPENNYFVFRNNDFLLTFDNKNYKTLKQFFSRHDDTLASN